jgi:hypothetical protein
LALKKAGIEEKQTREKYNRLMGRQRALYAKAGVDLASGSPLLVMSGTASEGEEEARMIRSGGQSEAERMRMYGKMSERVGIIEGMSTLFSGLSKVGEKKKKGGYISLFDLSYGKSEW